MQRDIKGDMIKNNYSANLKTIVEKKLKKTEKFVKPTE